MEAQATSSMRMSIRASRQHTTEIRLPAEIHWETLDKTRFFVLGAALFSGVNGMLYPSMVLKTQQQIIPGNVSSHNLALKILRSQGLPGLYKGFTTSLAGTIPARALYMSTLEITKSSVASISSRIGLSSSTTSAISNAAGGMSAAVAAQLVWTPIDVISQRLMVQGAEGARVSQYRGGIDALRTILRESGPAGLYRGFGMSIITYAPSNAIWWASYSMIQRSMWEVFGRSSGESPGGGVGMAAVGMQVASSGIAGGIAAVVTTPLDTIKTRIQVLEKKSGVMGTVRKLVAEEGWRGCYKGFGPRWASMTISATTMITTYEFLKRMSAKPRE